MKNCITLFLFFLAIKPILGQFCGTPNHTPAERAFFLNTIKNTPLLKNTGTTCLPIKPYVFRESNGTGGVSNEDLNKGLANLNLIYLEAGIEFFYSSLPSYIDNSDLNNYDQRAPDNDTQAQIIAAAGQVNNAINIYFVESIIFNGGFQAAGYAYFPNPFNGSNIIVMAHGSVSGTLTGTFAHEFGHYFSLPHTHSGTEDGPNSPNAENVARTGANANCSTAGDSFCDTDADPIHTTATFQSATCTYTGNATDMHGETYVPTTAITNIMSYYPDACVEGFSNEQYTAIAQGLVARQNPSNFYDYTAAPMVVAVPTGLTATFNNGVLLNWTDNANNEMGYIIERSQTSATSGFAAIFEGGTAPDVNSFIDLTATTPNTVYYYRIKASNGDCNAYSNVASEQITYCLASANQCDEILTNVRLGTINNSTNASDCMTSSYQNFSNLSTDLTVGMAETFRCTVSPFYNQDSISVWIDWNQDFIFDELTEKVFTMPVVSGGVTRNIIAPSSATAGNTRMRVRLFYQNNNEPCGTLTYGETEDYTVNIINQNSFCIDEDFNSFSGSSLSGNINIGAQTWTGNDVSAESALNALGGNGSAVRINANVPAGHLTSPSISAPDTLRFRYRSLNGGTGTFMVQKSVNGAAFQNVCTQSYSGNTYLTYSCIINETNPNVELRILSDNNNGPLIIDNFQVICGTAIIPVGNPTVQLSTSVISGTEQNASSITLTATTNTAVSANETVTLDVSGLNITPSDYSNAASITILNGSTSGTTTFDILDDSNNEITEKATVFISALSSGLDSGNIVSQNIIITDNDNPVLSVPASCSFESAAVGMQYTDVSGFDGNTDHDLVNNDMEPAVDYLYTGSGEIGFDALFFDGQNADGLTDGDLVGVTNSLAQVGAFTDGNNGYQISDIDGKIRIFFDPVSLVGFDSYNLSLDYFIASEDYEASDYLRIYAIVDGGVELELINTLGSDIDNLNIEGGWNTLNQTLITYTTAQLVIEASTNSAAETFFIDRISFTGSNDAVLNIATQNMTGFNYIEGNGPSAAQTNVVSWTNLVDSVQSLNSVNYFEFSIDGGLNFLPANMLLNIAIPPFPANYGPQNLEVRLLAGLSSGIYRDTIYLSTNDAMGVPIADTVYLSGEVSPLISPCSEIFFSEYIEGTGNNKCIEIYNPTPNSIDLSANNYQLMIYINGSSLATNILNLSGTIASGASHMVCHVNSNNVFSAAADQLTGLATWTGNDALALFTNGSLIDVIGQIGVDPGVSWTSAGVSTTQQTLVRKPNIQRGDLNGNDPFDPSVEWNNLGLDNSSSIGTHISDCIAADFVWTGASSTDWSTGSNWSSNIVPGVMDSAVIPDVSTASGNFPLMSSTVTVGEVLVEANATLNVAVGIILNGDFVNNGTLTLLDGAYLDDFTHSGSSFVGEIRVETIAANGVGNDQRFISSPVNTPNISQIGDDLLGPWGQGLPGIDGQAVTVSDCALRLLTPNSNYGNLFELDESIMVNCNVDGWTVRSSGFLENARGYSAFLPTGSTFDFEGNPNTGDIEIVTTNSGHSVLDGEGWNLIGNPYPSPISRNAVINAGATDIQYFVTTGVYQGSFAPYLPGSNIAVAQGFQVFVNNTRTIEMDNTFRNTNAATWYQSENWFDYKLEVSVFGNNFADKTILFYNQDASNSYEGLYDVKKYKSNVGQPSIATVNQGKELSLNGLNILDLGQSVPIAFYAGTNGTFSIDVNGMESFPKNTTIYLKDNLLNKVHNIEQGDYNFMANTNDNPNRFELLFLPEVTFNITNINCEETVGNIVPSDNSGLRKYQIYKDGSILRYGNLSYMDEDLEEGRYQMTLTDPYGGEQEYEFEIEANEKIKASLEISSQEVNIGEPVYLHLLTPNATSWSWNIGSNVLLENIEAPTYTFYEPGRHEIVLNVSNATCEDITTTIISVSNKTTSIEEQNSSDQISVFPNPIENTLNIVTNEAIKVKVYSIIGALVQETDQKTVSFKDLVSGVYFVQVSDLNGKNLLKKKVIKK